MKRFLSLFIILMLSSALSAQVIISLVLGDALNTDEVEFGLAGGMSRSYIKDITTSEGLNSFDLGFYFHIHLMKSSYLSTGVHVKSNVGAKGMPVYPMGDAAFDTIYQGGSLTKKIPCFYVPILFHQRFHNNRWYAELGPTLGLIYKPVDIFETSKLDGDLTYTRDVLDEYKRIDAGLMVGAGYKFQKTIKSMSAGASYYYGLVNVSNNPDNTIKNSAFYFFIRIPIGAGPKPEATE